MANAGISGFLSLLRGLTRFFTVAGAACSLALVFYVGRHNRSGLLLLAFAGWVVVPFATALWACSGSRTWTAALQVLYGLILVINLDGRVARGSAIPRDRLV